MGRYTENTLWTVRPHQVRRYSGASVGSHAVRPRAFNRRDVVSVPRSGHMDPTIGADTIVVPPTIGGVA